MVSLDEIKEAASEVTNFIDDEESRYYQANLGQQYDSFIQGAQWILSKVAVPEGPIKVQVTHAKKVPYTSILTGQEELRTVVSYNNLSVSSEISLSQLIENAGPNIREILIQLI